MTSESNFKSYWTPDEIEQNNIPFGKSTWIYTLIYQKDASVRFSEVKYYILDIGKIETVTKKDFKKLSKLNWKFYA